MRELRPSGFVRGALSNECPYRDRLGLRKQPTRISPPPLLFGRRLPDGFCGISEAKNALFG